MARANVCKKVVIFENGNPTGIRFEFGNGSSHVVLFEDFATDVREAAMAHGFSQTLGDSYSQSGGDANAAEGMFLSRLGNLKTGDWRTKGGGSGIADEDLAQALAVVTKRPVEEARERVAEEDKAWKDMRRKHPLVAAEIARIQAERKAEKAEESGADVEGLL